MLVMCVMYILLTLHLGDKRRDLLNEKTMLFPSLHMSVFLCTRVTQLSYCLTFGQWNSVMLVLREKALGHIKYVSISLYLVLQ